MGVYIEYPSLAGKTKPHTHTRTHTHTVNYVLCSLYPHEIAVSRGLTLGWGGGGRVQSLVLLLYGPAQLAATLQNDILVLRVWLNVQHSIEDRQMEVYQ